MRLVYFPLRRRFLMFIEGEFSTRLSSGDLNHGQGTSPMILLYLQVHDLVFYDFDTNGFGISSQLLVARLIAQRRVLRDRRMAYRPLWREVLLWLLEGALHRSCLLLLIGYYDYIWFWIQGPSCAARFPGRSNPTTAIASGGHALIRRMF